jgi:hypothetical protein
MTERSLMGKLTREKGWILEKIELEYNSYGDHEGKYTGKIRFQNGEYESFQFNLRPSMAKPYMKLIAKEVAHAADDLRERVVERLLKGLDNDSDREVPESSEAGDEGVES